jgi:hypothetical protein
MHLRPLTLLTVPLLCLVAAHLSAQSAALLPDAPHVVAANLGEITPDPPDVWCQSMLFSALPEPAAALLVASPPPPRPKVVDKKFITLGALVFGLTAMDMEFTQHCLQRHTCVELDPTLPHSRWGMYAVNTPVNVAVMYLAYKRRATGKWGWWLAPLIDIGAHAAGVGSNIRFLRK